MRFVDRVLCLMVFAALALLTGCGRHKDAKTAAGAPTAGSPRTVPVVFYMLEGPTEGDRNRATDEDLLGAVTLSNQVYADAFVQFFVHDVRRLPMKRLHRNDDQVVASWGEVAEDAMRIAPSVAQAGFRADETATLSEWLGQTFARTEPDMVHVLVTPFWGSNGVSHGSACASPYPHDDGLGSREPSRGPAWSKDHSRVISCHPNGDIPGWRLAALPHEFGHYLGGLNHTFDATNEWAATTAGDSVEEYWDLVYAPLASGGIATFTDRASAAKAKGHLKPIDEGAKVVRGSACNTEIRPTGGRGEKLRFSLVETPGALGGLAFAPRRQGEKNAINLMSYLYDTPSTTPCDLRLSRSQIEILHKKMAGRRGSRNLIGTVPRTVWRPPVS